MLGLKTMRTEQALTQGLIADRVGISISHYSMIESGERRPSPEVARRIADVLGFSDEWYKLLEPDKKADA